MTTKHDEDDDIAALPVIATDRAVARRLRDKVELVADGSKPESLIESVRILVAHGEVVRSFARRSLKIRYKQSVLGVAWAVVQPLATLAIFVVFFGRVAKISGGGVPYAAFAISALGPWQFVSNAISFGSLSVINEGALLRKVYFPRMAPVIGAVASNLVDLSIMLVLLLLLEPILGGQLGASLVTVPLIVLVLVIPTLGLCLFLAGLAVFYRDLKYVVPFAVQFLMFASPVAYPISNIPSQWQLVYAAANPWVGPVSAFRDVFALGTYPDWTLLGISAATGFVMLFAGYELFKHLEPEMADEV